MWERDDLEKTRTCATRVVLPKKGQMPVWYLYPLGESSGPLNFDHKHEQ